MNDPLTLPVVRYELSVQEGEPIVREWSLNDRPPVKTPELPEFLVHPHRRWDHPQDPVTFLADVLPGREADARAWIEAQ